MDEGPMTGELALSEGEPLVLTADDPPDACAALSRAAQHADRGVVSVTESGRTVRQTYPELLLAARRLLTGLRAHGCGVGDPVVLHGLPLPEFFPAVWACVLGGLRPVSIALPLADGVPSASLERLRHVCRLFDGPLVLAGGPAEVARVRAAVRGLATVAAVADLAAGEPADPHVPDLDDVALCMLSSGSTGLPKAIPITHRGLAECAAGARRMLGVRPGHVTVNWLPLDHSGAFLLYHMLPVFAAATNVHAPAGVVLGDPLRWLDLLAEHRAQHTWAPNFAYQLVADALTDRGDRTWDLGALSSILTGGEQVTMPVLRRFLDATAEFGLRPDHVVPAWGMAETVTAITYGRLTGPGGVHRVLKSSVDGQLRWADEDAAERDVLTLVALGRPAPGAAVRVVDERNEVLPAGRIGRLQVRSAARVTAGYLGDEDATRALFPDHERTGRTWLDSGDLAFVADGQVVMTGRAKDMIILNGHNFLCHEIEDVVAGVPGLRAGSVAACGVPDQRTGSEELRVFVATDEPEPAALVRAVRAELFARLGISGCRVVPVPVREFPRTPTGKVRRAALRDRALPGDAPADLRERVGEIVAAVLGRDVDATTPFYELGMTSLALRRTCGLLTEELGREIPVTALFAHPTVTALAEHLSGHQAAAPSSPPAPPAPRRTDQVAIVGMALRFPGASTVDEFWANLRAGVDSVRTFTPAEVRAAGVPARIADAPTFRPVIGALPDVAGFDAAFFGMSPKEAELTDPAHRLFLECCEHALEDAGYAGDGARIGVYAGSGMNLYGHQDDRRPADGDPADRDPADGDPGGGDPASGDLAVALQSTVGAAPDFLASRVAYRLGLTGPAVGVRTACSTSLVAVHLAAQAVLTGDADLALAGAAAVRVPQEAGYRHHPGSVLSETGRLRSFDATADGTVGGNGVAVVLLKPLAAALADGDTVHAVILGSSVNNDGRGKVGFTAPSVAGQVEVIRDAIRRAGVPAESIGYVEAHATGTELGDPVEFEALSTAYASDRTAFCALGSVKPNVGHLDSCAGMAGLIKAVLMVRHGEIVPTLHLTRPNPAMRLAGSPFTLAVSGREWTSDGPRRAGVSALGVGGTNAHVILEEPPARTVVPANGKQVLVPLSAMDPATVATMATALCAVLTAHPAPRPEDVATTLALGRRHLPARLAVVGGEVAELATALSGPHPRPGPPLGPVVFVFSGQNGVRAGMATSLYADYPAVRAVLDECERVRPGLRAQLLGAPVRDTQPVLFALQAALVALWRAVGLVPAAVAGHSLGEYAALHAAGALSLADGLRLTAARGEAMAATEPGGMVALNTTVPAASRLAAEYGCDVAAVNGPEAVVLSGRADAVTRLTATAEAEGVGCVRLSAGRAFHAAPIEPALPALSEAAATVAWQPLRVPMISGLDGRVLPAGATVGAEYPCRHAREPVRFDLVVSTVESLGHGDLLELGPGDVLTRLGRRVYPGGRWQAGPFLPAVAELYRRGLNVKWGALAMEGRRVPLPVYPFQRAERAERLPVAEVCRVTAGLLGHQDAIDPDATFVDLGADSLVLMNMTRELEKTFGARVPVRVLFDSADTPRKLAEVIGRRPEPAPTTDSVPEPVAPPPSPPPTPAAVLPHAAAPPAAASPPGGSSAMLGEPSQPADGLQAIIDRQLSLAERMVDQVTALMSEQLAAVRGGQPAAARTATPPAPARTAPPADEPPAATPVSVPVSVPMSVPVSVPTAPSPVPAPAVPPGSLSLPAKESCDFSLYFFGDYPDSRQTGKYDLITAAACFADQHDFHALWLPERHFNSFGALFPNPSVLAAALAARTSTIRLNAGSVVLPLHHPVRVAEEWSVVDNLSGGRVGLCVASGWHATDFALAPDNFGQHRDLMYTQLDTVRRLWAGEPVTMTSGSGEPVDIRLHPRPLQAEPPLYVAVVGNPDSYRRAAAAGLGIVTNLMAQSVEQLATNIALYRATRAAHGLDPAAGRVVVLVHTFLGDDVDRVRAEAFGPFCAYLRSTLSLFDQVTTSLGVEIDLETTPAEDVDFLLGQAYRRYCESRALIGTVDGGSAIVSTLLAAGVDEIACFVDFGVAADRVLSALPVLDELRGRFTERRPLSAAQRRIWFLDRLYPGQTIYHEPKAIRFTGPLDTDTLRTALRRAVQRQPALRTVFRDDDDGGEPHRIVLPAVDLDCQVADRTGATESAALREALATIGREVFDLATGPLLAARLYRLSPEHHLLFLSTHHIVFDSASTAALVRDVAAFYRAWPGEPTGLPPLSATDGDAPAATPDGIAFWRAQLADAPEPRLPTDRPRPAVRTGAGAGLSHELDPALVERLHAHSRTEGVTLFMTMLGAVAAVLGRFAGQDDIVLGTAVSNRPPEAAHTVGLFLDTVPLRVDLSGDPTFADLARRVRDTTSAALEHRGVPFDELVSIVNPRREAGRNPLFSVMVEYENESTVDFAPPLRATLLDVPADRAPFDLSLYLTRHAGGLRVGVEYDADLFVADTVTRLLAHLDDLLRRVTADPSAPLSRLTSAGDADRAAVAAWQGAPAAGAACLHELVEQQVDRTPDAPAVLAGATELTYRELDERANRVANSLLAGGIARGDLVAVRLPRGPELVATLLGVLKAGAAYLPIDPALPAARVDLMLADSAPARLLTSAPDDGSATRPAVPVAPDDLAYCIYTSGSSGRPKGVLVPHRGPANVVRWQLAQHPPLRTLQWTAPSFDVSVQEIFSTLAAGAPLVLLDDEVRYDPAEVAALARRHRVERIFMPYTPLKYLLETRPALPDLRVVMSAGERLVLTPAMREFFAADPDRVLYNQYGPTEGSIIVTSHRVDLTAGAAPPIGRPIDGVTVEVLGDRGEQVPVGAVGELHLGGTALASGYLNRPEETAAVFAGGRYRTGDLGRWRPDGTLEYLGRRDEQVKIRGYRVEPGEAEHAVAGLAGVRDAAVVAREGRAGEPELVAYVVLADGAELDGLAPELADVLPGYLVPTRWVALPRLPVNANGKLDRARLPAPPSDVAGAAPATPAERAVHELWCAELASEKVPVDRSFFAVGGHSLSAVRLINRMSARLGLECTMSEFFRDPTIRGLAGRLASAPPAEVVERAPLTSSQRRLFRRHHDRENPAVFNVAHRVDLTGDLDPGALRTAFDGLVRRHGALRGRIRGQETEVMAPFSVDLPVEDVAPDEVDGWCAALAAEPIALDHAPLFRLRLGRVGQDRWVLSVVCHHMVVDGASFTIMWRDLSALYPAARAGRDAALPPAPQHVDYARWGCDAARQAELVRFWRTELSGVELFPPLPADEPRPARLSGRGGLHRGALPADLVHRIGTAAAEAGGTPYAVLATGFARWLAGVCGCAEVVLAVSSANRTRPERDGILGNIGEAVLVRVRPDQADPVRSLSASLFAALDHQDLPLAEVVELVAPELAGTPFPPVLFTVVTAHEPATLAIDGLTSRITDVPVPGLARTELYVRLVVDPSGVAVWWEYAADLFSASTIARWDAELCAELARLVRGADGPVRAA